MVNSKNEELERLRFQTAVVELSHRKKLQFLQQLNLVNRKLEEWYEDKAEFFVLMSRLLQLFFCFYRFSINSVGRISYGAV